MTDPTDKNAPAQAVPRPPLPQGEEHKKLAEDWYTWGFQAGLDCPRPRIPPQAASTETLQAIARLRSIFRDDDSADLSDADSMEDTRLLFQEYERLAALAQPQAVAVTDEIERLRDLLRESRQYVSDAGFGCEDDNEVKVHSEALLALIDQALAGAPQAAREVSIDEVWKLISDEWGSHLCWRDSFGQRACGQDNPHVGCRCKDIAKAITSEFSLSRPEQG